MHEVCTVHHSHTGVLQSSTKNSTELKGNVNVSLTFGEIEEEKGGNEGRREERKKERKKGRKEGRKGCMNLISIS